MANISTETKPKKRIDTGLYYVTTSKNLLSILGAGAVYPAAYEYRYYDDSRKLYNGMMPLWSGDIPEELRLDQEGGIAEKTVVLELDKKILNYLKITNDFSKDSNGYITPQPLPVSFINRYIFTSKDAFDNFLLRLFDEVLVDKDRFVTDVSVPWAKKNYDLYQRTLPDLRDTREAMHLRDKGAGAFLAVFTLAPSKRELISMVDSFFPLSVSLACGEEISEEFFQFIASCSNGKKVHNTDWWMFRFVINYMAKISPDDGFDPYQFIESISNAAREADESISNEITRWCDYVKKVLDGDTGVPQLSDTGNVVQRAVMLFLLRPKIDRMENAPDTALHPGPVVYTIATFLIGFYTGAVRLGLPYKQSYNNFTSFMEYFLKSVSQKLNGIKWTRSHIAIEAQDAILSSKAIFKVRDENILYKEMKPNPVLARVYYQAKTAGYPLEYDCAQDALMCQVEIEEERSQTVRVMCVSVNHHGDEVIRFSSPCMNFKTKKAIKREMAIDLLERNNELDMHCRFALNNERNEIVVQVDQVVMNMDDGELKAHIENVARIAGNYEKQVSNVDKY